MDNFWILAWVLITFNGWKGDINYSPPVKTLEDCQRMQNFTNANGNTKSQCVQITVQREISRL